MSGGAPAAAASLEAGDLKRRSARGGIVLLASQGAKLLLQALSVAVLSRLLLPADFGLMAMVAPVGAFIALFTDLGLVQATVQRAEVSAAQLSALYWLSVGCSLVLAAATLLLAPLVGLFYGEPRATPLVMALALPLLFAGLANQHLALLNRHLRYRALAAVEVTALAAGLAAGVAVAWRTGSYAALVVPQIVAAMVTALLASLLSGWRPGLPRGAAGVGAMLRFGGNLTGFNLANFLARNLDNVLIGKVWGEASLGLYDQAYKLLMFPLTQISFPISRIATPLLSRLAPDPARYREAYLQLLGQVLLVLVPGVVFLAVTAPVLVPLVLGPRWHGVVPIFRLLAFGALIGPVSQSTGWLFVTQDRTGEMFRCGLVSATLFVASFVAGLPFGPVGVAASYTAVGVLLQGPFLWWAATRRGPVGLADLLRLVGPFGAAAAVAAAALLALARAAAGAPAPLLLAAGLPLAYGGAFATLALFRRGRQELAQSRRLVAQLRG